MKFNLFADVKIDPVFTLCSGILKQNATSFSECTINSCTNASTSCEILVKIVEVNSSLREQKSLGGDTTTPSRLYARLWLAFLVFM